MVFEHCSLNFELWSLLFENRLRTPDHCIHYSPFTIYPLYSIIYTLISFCELLVLKYLCNTIAK